MNHTTQFIRLVRRFPTEAKPAAARLRAQLDFLEADARDHHRVEAHRRGGLIDAAHSALESDSSVLPADLEAKAITGWLSSSPTPLRESCNGNAVELYVSTVVDSAVTSAADSDEDFDAGEFEYSRRRELDPEAPDLMAAERPFLLGKWLAGESRDITKLRSRDELWELAVGLVVANGLELTMTELGFEEEWDVGFATEEGNFFGWRDGVSTYADLLLPDSDGEDPLGPLANHVADRLDAVYHGIRDDGQGPAVMPAAKPKRRGRPQQYDPEADAGIAERWKASGEKVIADHAIRIGMDPKKVEQALERHRKRQKKS